MGVGGGCVVSVSSVACCEGDQWETLPGSGQRQERTPWEGACGAVMPPCSWPFGKQMSVLVTERRPVRLPSCLGSLLPRRIIRSLASSLAHAPTTPAASFFRTLRVLAVQAFL